MSLFTCIPIHICIVKSCPCPLNCVRIVAICLHSCMPSICKWSTSLLEFRLQEVGFVCTQGAVFVVTSTPRWPNPWPLTVADKGSQIRRVVSLGRGCLRWFSLILMFHIARACAHQRGHSKGMCSSEGSGIISGEQYTCYLTALITTRVFLGVLGSFTCGSQ